MRGTEPGPVDPGDLTIVPANEAAWADLAAATVRYAKGNGARALEGYAMRTQPGKQVTWGELYVGAVQVFAEAGFAEVSTPSARRVVMRVDFTG
jgi:hypothetical protein